MGASNLNFSVLEAITPSVIGGAEVLVAEISAGLPNLGVRVEVFCPKGRRFLNLATQRGIPTLSWKTHGKIDPITIIRLAHHIKRKDISVVHTHLSTASLLGALAAKLAGCPSVAHVHGMNSAFCFKYSTRLIAVSEAVKDHLCSQGVPENKIYVIHNGVDLARFTPMPILQMKEALGVDHTVPTVGMFGRLAPEKGYRTAMQAIKCITKVYPEVTLLIVGDGRERQDLEQYADFLGIGSHVRFEGFVPDIVLLMSACDLVLVPSIKEGFGLAAVEAMALERPVIAAAAGGLCEIVIDGETGILVPPENPEAMASALVDVLSKPSRALEMGEKGRRRVFERFNFQKQLELLATVLHRECKKQ